MVSDCPECGARLNIVRARDSTEALGGDVSNANPQQHEQPKAANSLIPNIDTNEADLQRLKELICAPTKRFHGRPRPRTMRPDLSDEATLHDKATQEALFRVASQMQSAIRRTGEQSVDTLLESKRGGRDDYHLPARLERVLEAVGAILYEQERARSVDEEMHEAEAPLAEDTTSITGNTRDGNLCSWYVFELMLLTDYGFPPYPLRGPWIVPNRFFLDSIWSEFNAFSSLLVATAHRWQQGGPIPDTKDWDYIARAIGKFELFQLDVWDVAIMFYYYNSHRKPVSTEDGKEGWTGYTGILQEMIAEVPTRGVDRLERKLSLDVHLLIPRFVSGRERREQMISIAQDLASLHGCQLAPSKVSRWRRWFDSLAGFPPARQSLQDEEKGGEKEKLLN